MLYLAILTQKFNEAANEMHAEQWKVPREAIQELLNNRWRRLINSLDEMIFIVESSSHEDFDYQKVRRDYDAGFSLSLVPHNSFLHPLCNPEFAIIREQGMSGVNQTQPAHQQILAPHLRAVLPPQARAAQTQAAPPHLALVYTYNMTDANPDSHYRLDDHIAPHRAPKMVCPCQLSGHRCQQQPHAKRTHDGRFRMCGLEEVCTKQACTDVPPDQRCRVRYHARPTCGGIKGTMPCPRNTNKLCQFGHDGEGEDWRRVLHEFESTVHHPR